MPGKPSSPAELHVAWHSLSHRIAAAGGSLAALLSLLGDAGVSTACVRGGCTYLAIRVAGRLGALALERASRMDAAAQRVEEEPGS